MLGWLEPLELDMNCYAVKVLKMRLDKKTFNKRDVFPSELLSKKKCDLLDFPEGDGKVIY